MVRTLDKWWQEIIQSDSKTPLRRLSLLWPQSKSNSQLRGHYTWICEESLLWLAFLSIYLYFIFTTKVAVNFLQRFFRKNQEFFLSSLRIHKGFAKEKECVWKYGGKREWKEKYGRKVGQRRVSLSPITIKIEVRSM